MSNRIEEATAQALRAITTRRLTWDEVRNFLEHLQAQDIAVVDLPKPTMHSGAGDPVWQALIGSESEDVYFEGDETVVSGTCQLLPDELVPLAAALLAAEKLIRTPLDHPEPTYDNVRW